jgi:hypothetical protein
MRGLRGFILLGLAALMAFVVWNWLTGLRLECTATPATIPAGGSATLAWTTANATSVVIDHEVGLQTVGGSTVVRPAVTTSYTLTATGPRGTVSKSVTVTIEAPPARQVAVATHDLFWGTTLTAEMLKLEPFPETSLPEGYFSDLRGLEGRFLLANLATNEPILASKLAPPGGMAAVTHQAKRARAVPTHTTNFAWRAACARRTNHQGDVVARTAAVPACRIISRRVRIGLIPPELFTPPRVSTAREAHWLPPPPDRVCAPASSLSIASASCRQHTMRCNRAPIGRIYDRTAQVRPRRTCAVLWGTHIEEQRGVCRGECSGQPQGAQALGAAGEFRTHLTACHPHVRADDGRRGHG